MARRHRARRGRGHGREHAPSGPARSEGGDRAQWIGLIAASLPGLAALGALLFTWMQVGQARKELRIAEHGQITSRFNAAVGNLGSSSLDIRLGGIYALRRIMQDSPRDHPTVVSVLAAFAQRHAGSSTESLKEPPGSAFDRTPEPDVRAAVTTLAERRPDRDAGAAVDLNTTDLRGLRLKGPIRLSGADLSDADLRWARLNGADLRKARLTGANLDYLDLEKGDLRGANLTGASLSVANLKGADLRRADLTCGSEVGEFESGTAAERLKCVDLQRATLDGTDFRGAALGRADLRHATLTAADLRDADLSDANLAHADLTDADFRGATLTGVNLQGARRTGARGLPPGGLAFLGRPPA